MRRTTRHGDVHRNHVRNTADGRVTLAEYPAGAAAIADRDDELRIRRRFIGSPERELHVARDGARHEQQVRVPRARDEFDAVSFEVVERIAERVDLELAAVARARVDLTDAKRAAQQRANLRL